MYLLNAVNIHVTLTTLNWDSSRSSRVKVQALFYVEAGGQLAIAPSPKLSLAPNLWLQQQYAVVKPVNSYTGGVDGGLEWLIWQFWPVF